MGSCEGHLKDIGRQFWERLKAAEIVSWAARFVKPSGLSPAASRISFIIPRVGNGRHGRNKHEVYSSYSSLAQEASKTQHTPAFDHVGAVLEAMNLARSP